ncbi:hypothetical protein [Actinoplanes sp. NPDC026619]|uniref:hypothetical protein n=1 Tax=Actinoplanes sp. NPDC026619 TaxID=3155798 RepID=UPI0033F08EFF
MTSNLKSTLRRDLGRVARFGRDRRQRVAAMHRLTPVHVRVVTCCRGWYFEHSAQCRTPHVSRPCSDCYADPGIAHIYPCCSWFDVEPVGGPDEASLWPDAARWPGHPIAE